MKFVFSFWDVFITECLSLKNGAFDSVVMSGITYNSTAVYTCITGYYMTDGNLIRTCENGTWSGSPPVCTIRGIKLIFQFYISTI